MHVFTIKITVLKKVPNKTAELVSNATISGLKPYSGSILTITGDNVLIVESSFFYT